MAPPWVIRPATNHDAPQILQLLENAEFKHRHLDWRQPGDWLGHPPFWVIEQGNQLRSMLALPADPPHIAWVRLFAAGSSPSLRQSWNGLFEHCLTELPPRTQTTIAALGLSPWFCRFVEESGFKLRQNIIVLEWDFILPPERKLPAGLIIRSMESMDLEQVHHIDAAAFEPIWQNSSADIFMSFQSAGCCTVAELDGKVVGYQVSTISRKHLHLTRLAVDPALQRLSIGFGIVYHLQQYCLREGFTGLTVNTQDDNHSSRALYQKCNFCLNGDAFPVYIYP